MAKHVIRIGDQLVEVDAGQFAIEAAGEGSYVVSDESRRYRVTVAGPPDDRWIHVDGRVARIEIVAAGQTRTRTRSRSPDMAAPMPATVVKILVQPGATVTAGATVLMLEAMKMELAIRAARGGVVRAINCKPGDLVQPGVPLVEIDDEHVAAARHDR